MKSNSFPMKEKKQMRGQLFFAVVFRFKFLFFLEFGAFCRERLLWNG